VTRPPPVQVASIFNVVDKESAAGNIVACAASCLSVRQDTIPHPLRAYLRQFAESRETSIVSIEQVPPRARSPRARRGGGGE
jgi:hypothetical protein